MKGLTLLLYIALISLLILGCRPSRADRAFADVDRGDSVEEVIALAGRPCRDFSRPFPEQIDRSATGEVTRVLAFEMSRTSEMLVFLGEDGRVLFKLLAMNSHRREKCGGAATWGELLLDIHRR